MQKPTEEFCDALFSSGTSWATCELCEREHFNYEVTNEKDHNIYEEMMDKSNKNPDKYIDHGDCSVGLGWIDGKQVVYDCPCCKIRAYENWIEAHEYIILDFFSNRNKATHKDLKLKEDMLEKAKKEKKNG